MSPAREGKRGALASGAPAHGPRCGGGWRAAGGSAQISPRLPKPPNAPSAPVAGAAPCGRTTHSGYVHFQGPFVRCSEPGAASGAPRARVGRAARARVRDLTLDGIQRNPFGIQKGRAELRGRSFARARARAAARATGPFARIWNPFFFFFLVAWRASAPAAQRSEGEGPSAGAEHQCARGGGGGRAPVPPLRPLPAP